MLRCVEQGASIGGLCIAQSEFRGQVLERLYFVHDVQALLWAPPDHSAPRMELGADGHRLRRITGKDAWDLARQLR